MQGLKLDELKAGPRDVAFFRHATRAMTHAGAHGRDNPRFRGSGSFTVGTNAPSNTARGPEWVKGLHMHIKDKFIIRRTLAPAPPGLVPRRPLC